MAVLKPYDDVSDDHSLANVKPKDLPIRTSNVARRLRRQYLQRLPVELLVEILRWWKAVSSWLPAPQLYQHILGIAQVSRQWRDVALRMPELWTTIYPFERTEIIDEMLTRSGQASLTLRLNAAQDELDRLVDHFNRVEDLSVIVTPDSPPTRNVVMPKLHTLTVTIDVPDDLFDSPSFHTIDSLRMPCLVNLTVRSGYFPWIHRLLHTNLTHLTFVVTSTWVGFYFDAVEIYATLQNMTKLEHLHLQSAFCHCAPLVPTQSVCLPALRSLVLHESIRVCAEFLEGVNMPALRALELDATVDSAGEITQDKRARSLERLGRAIIRVRNGTDQQHMIQTLAFHVDEVHNRLRCLIWAEHIDVSSDTHPPPLINLTLHLHETEHLHDITALSSTLPLSWLKVLHIKSNNRFSLPTAWGALAQHAHGIEELYCSGWVINALWTVLSPDAAVLDYVLHGTVAFPALRTLTVCDTMIDVGLFYDFWGNLVRRAQLYSMAKIEVLRLKSCCDVDQGSAVRMVEKGVVGSVVCDDCEYRFGE